MEYHICLGIFLAWLTMLCLAWRWELGMRAGLAAFAFPLLAGALVEAVGWSPIVKGGLSTVLVWFLALGMGLAVMAHRFYRDPERTPPRRPGILVSPADGTVIYVRQSANGVLPVATKSGRSYHLVELTRTPLCTGEASVIGIRMSFIDVHVNRAPCSGRVTFRKHFPGLFGSLRHQEMSFQNERATTVIAQDGIDVAVVQIASRLVRQITVFLREGQDVTLGERLGVIRLGSQVDVVLASQKKLKIRVKPGDQLLAGESIIAEFG